MSKASNRSSKKSSSKSEDSKYPSPFDKAPESIKPFLDQLDTSQIYITHIDRHATDYKKQIFIFAILVNSTIALLLAWRLYVAVPKYLALLRTMFGFVSNETVDTLTTTRKEQIWIVLRRTMMMALDFLLFRFIGPWPMTFFLERPANPVTWRCKVRFLREEVVVRVSRNWAGEDLMKGTKRGEQSPFFKTRIEPAIERKFMQKTAYLMMDGNWDLDFGLMQDAHVLLKEEKLKSQDLNGVVLAHQEGSGWLSWKFGDDSDSVDVGVELKKAMQGLDASEGSKPDAER